MFIQINDEWSWVGLGLAFTEACIHFNGLKLIKDDGVESLEYKLYKRLTYFFLSKI